MLRVLLSATVLVATICGCERQKDPGEVSWVMWNIPPSVHELAESVPPKPELPDGSRQGISDFRRPGYGGPCPPSGVHRYYFKVYALDTMLDLPSSTRRADLLKAMKGHILAEGQLMGRYGARQHQESNIKGQSHRSKCKNGHREAIPHL